MSYLGIFGIEFYKTFGIFEISPLDSAYMQTFVKKTKMSKFGTKNALLGYFWTEI